MAQCALSAQYAETADVFLWGSRRVLEAMLRALLCPYPPRRFSELTVKGLLDDAVQRTIVPEDQLGSFETIWRLGRSAIRVKDHRHVDHSQLVPDCAGHLVRAVHWFFEKSPARRQPSTTVEESLAVLSGLRRAVSREEEVQARQERLVRELETLLEERRERLEALAKRADDFSGQVAVEREAVEGASKRLAALRSEVSEPQGFPRFSVPRPGAGGAREAGPERLRWLLGVLGGFCAGVVLAYFIISGGGSTPSPPPADSSAQPSAPDASVVSQPSPPGDAQPEAVDAAPAPAPDGEAAADQEPVPRCPSGMVEFEAATVRVMQPFPRKSWPAGPETLDAVEVPPFCLDREPVLVSSYEECAAKGGCRPRIKCLEQPRNFPATCLTWREASAYCQWRGGSLPSVAQWERTLLQGGKVRAEPARGTWEWVVDPFPAAVFKRGEPRTNPDGSIWGYMTLQKLFVPDEGEGRICSWHKAPATASRGNLTFRCVLPVVEE